MSNVAPYWVLADPDLALSYGEDRSKTTSETPARCRRRLSHQLVKIVLVVSQHAARLFGGKGKARGRKVGAVSAAYAALCPAAEEAERLHCER